MTDVLLIAPIALPLLGAAAAAASGKRFFALVGTTAWAAACAAVGYAIFTSGIRTTQLGGWPVPFGITLVADHLAAIFLVVAGIVGLACAASRPADDAEQPRIYYPLVLVLLAAVSGAVLTGDLFNLFVWFELLLVASFVLLVIRSGRERLEGAIKYAVISTVGTLMLLSAVGLTYGLTGTLNMADAAVKMRTAGDVATAVWVLFLLGLGLKSAAFPLHFWLPAAYPAAAPALGALFGGLLTKVGIYGIIRVFTLIVAAEASFARGLLMWMALATMVVGAAGALAQRSIRRMISFLIVATSGFMLAGVALGTARGLTATIFYLVEDAVAVSALFLIAALIRARQGTDRIDERGGLARRPGLIAGMFFIPALSVSGLPPLPGFWSKLTLARAGLETSHFLVVAFLLASTLIVLAAVLRVWLGEDAPTRDEAADSGAPDHGHDPTDAPDPAQGPRRSTVLGPALALVAAVVAVAAFAGPVMDVAGTAADELLDPDRYIEAVMEGRP